MRHHAIVVTSWKEEAILRAHVRASSLFPWVSEISPDEMNGYRSFLIPPDGSKEGWDDSTAGDKRRNEFIGYLNEQAYDDGSSVFDWVEVQFGDDERKTKVTRDSDHIGDKA